MHWGWALSEWTPWAILVALCRQRIAYTFNTVNPVTWNPLGFGGKLEDEQTVSAYSFFLKHEFDIYGQALFINIILTFLVFVFKIIASTDSPTLFVCVCVLVA